MKFANGRDVTVGALVVGMDSGGNLVAGQVMQLLERANAVRLLGSPLLVEPGKALLVEDAYSLALLLPKLEAQLLETITLSKNRQAQLEAAEREMVRLQEELVKLSPKITPFPTAPAENGQEQMAQGTAAAPENQTTPTNLTNPTAVPEATPPATAANPS